jgi:hypothetical protein
MLGARVAMVPMEAGGEFRLCRVDKIGGNEVTSKRRKDFPSETQVKRGTRVVGGCKEVSEKLGRRNNPCPCLSGRRFQELLHAQW